MKYARIINSVVQEVIDFNPVGNFTSEVAALFVAIPDNVFPRDTKNSDGTFTAYVAPPAPAPAPAPVVPLPTIITTLAFRNRFTMAEKVTIEIACLDNPSAAMSARQQSAALRVNQADTAAATYIDLSRADTRAGVTALQTAGIIAAGRAAVILDTPVAESERPRD